GEHQRDTAAAADLGVRARAAARRRRVGPGGPARPRRPHLRRGDDAVLEDHRRGRGSPRQCRPAALPGDLRSRGDPVTGVEPPRARLAGPSPDGAPPTTDGFVGLDFAGPGFAGSGLTGAPGLSGRLTALARVTQIGATRSGHDGFDPGLLRESEDLLARAGERLRLSAGHTVVVLAGGTGSGKSSLFNRLASADLSPVGGVPPMTRAAYSCVSGMAGSGPL